MWRRIAKWAAFPLAEEIVRIFVLPFVAPIGVAVMGWFQDIEPFYLAVGVILTFAGVMTWFVRFDEWRHRNRIADKLTFHSIRTGKVLNEQGKVIAIRIGVLLSNKSLFPILYQIVDLKTEFDNHYPPKKPYERSEFTIPAGGSGWFDDHHIPITQKADGTFAGQFRGTFRYGRPGRVGHTLEVSKRLPAYP